MAKHVHPGTSKVRQLIPAETVEKLEVLRRRLKRRGKKA